MPRHRAGKVRSLALNAVPQHPRGAAGPHTEGCSHSALAPGRLSLASCSSPGCWSRGVGRAGGVPGDVVWSLRALPLPPHSQRGLRAAPSVLPSWPGLPLPCLGLGMAVGQGTGTGLVLLPQVQEAAVSPVCPSVQERRILSDRVALKGPG